MKIGKYKETVKTQEKVISKMQSLVESRLRPVEELPMDMPVDAKVAEEIYKLNIILSEERERNAKKDAEISELKLENQSLKSQV